MPAPPWRSFLCPGRPTVALRAVSSLLHTDGVKTLFDGLLNARTPFGVDVHCDECRHYTSASARDAVLQFQSPRRRVKRCNFSLIIGTRDERGTPIGGISPRIWPIRMKIHILPAWHSMPWEWPEARSYEALLKPQPSRRNRLLQVGTGGTWAKTWALWRDISGNRPQISLAGRLPPKG